MSRCSYKICLADIGQTADPTFYLLLLTMQKKKKNLEPLKAMTLSPLGKICIILQALSCVCLKAEQQEEAVLFLVDKMCKSFFNGFSLLVNGVIWMVCNRKECSPSFSSHLFLCAPLRLLVWLPIAYLLTCSTIQRGTASSLCWILNIILY